MKKWQRLFYTPNLPLGDDGHRLTASSAHTGLAKMASEEGMVLLKNENNILPLSQNIKLALFGKGTFDYVKGGGGSGDVTVAYTVNLYDGLKKLPGKPQIFEELAGFYKDSVNNQYLEGKQPGLISEPILPEGLINNARAFTDTAIISISRFSGEGWDRISKYDPPAENKDDKASIFEDGDFYLSHAEKLMVEQVTNLFPRVIVVMNVGGMVDTEWFKSNSRIQGVLMAWQGGMEGGNAAAELLCGIANPSGKLSDTFAKCLEDYPSTRTFHESKDYVSYTEDIYVGYRYFETIPGAYDKVNYEFGYGLSYTSFKYTVQEVSYVAGSISVYVLITNTGTVPGKEVLQLYAAPPQGLLGKPAKNLIAFSKTSLLQPGEKQLILLSFHIYDLASFDDLGKVQKAAYVLEKGQYEFYIGTSIRKVQKLDYMYTADENIIVKQLTALLTPSNLYERMLADGTYEKLPQSNNTAASECRLEEKNWMENEGLCPPIRAEEGINPRNADSNKKKYNLIDVAEGTISLDDFTSQLSDEDLMYLVCGQPNTGVANTYGFGNLLRYGIPNAMTADGPAGLRIQEQCGVTTTAFPCCTSLACTWNPDITYRVGKSGAEEVKENNIAMWLTPAINIHRSPLCGRNFEYYSEDPLLAGKMAASMVKGIQSMHISASVKHFALNSKETNRRNSDSRVSERAAREIYLKAFNIIVKEADPWCIMTSYNLINGHRASESKDLLWGILRGEWEYNGLVISDWWNDADHYKEVLAGNDVKMARGYVDRLTEAMEKKIITRKDLLFCAKNVLTLLLKLD